MRLSKNYYVDERTKVTGGARAGLMNLAAHVDVSQPGFGVFQICRVGSTSDKLLPLGIATNIRS
jgi:hypothetical protein